MRDPFGIEAQVMAAMPESIKDPKAAWEKIAARLRYTFRQQFLTGGNGGWAKQQHPMGTKLMMLSGALYESETTSSDETSAQLNWGGGLPYARIRQTGGFIRVTKESRKFFWAKYFETKDEYFKNLALTRKSFFFTPGRPITLTTEDLNFIANTLGTRDFKVTTNYGPSLS
jgi:phage gpG-like protein